MLMLTGAFIGFLLGIALGFAGRADWPTVLWRACAGAAAMGLLMRWWGRIWLRGLQISLQERRAAEAATRQQLQTTTTHQEMTAPASMAMTDEVVANKSQPAPQELWRCYHRTGDSETENALVEEYLPLVRTVVGRLAMTLPAHVSVDDLESAALLGLLQAIRSFTPSGGASFETFARFRIRGAVLDELRRMDWVPRLVHDKARKIQDALGELEQRLGRAADRGADGPSAGHHAGGVSRLAGRNSAGRVHLSGRRARCGSTKGQHLMRALRTIPRKIRRTATSRSELKELIAQRIRQLPQMQQKVLALYYFEDLRLREIAEAFGLTESRISQIHSQAILAIRSFIERQEAMAVQRGSGGHA